MTSSNQDGPTPPPARSAGATQEPQYADRTYRSTAGMVGGVALIVLAGWLGGDGIVHGHGHAPWLAVASLLLALPLIVAFTLRPAVFANPRRVRVRNPFRVIAVPWEGVDGIRSGYSTELLAGGRKYQLWAVPVSLRARKRATKQTMRARAAGVEDPFGGSSRRIPGSRASAAATAAAGRDQPIRAWSDQAVDELRELQEAHERPAGEASPSPQPEVRWSWEILAPSVAGAVALAILLAIGG